METIFFETINNKRVFCYLSEPKLNSCQKKIVIMSHGFRGSNVGPARQFVDFQRILNKEGYFVLRFDQPNSANSDGDYVDSSFNEWINTIVYFAKKYIDQGYKASLLGQSMGATASIAATNNLYIKDKISCILLWVPGIDDAYFEGEYEKVLEEGGQKYIGKFWEEALQANTLNCLKKYKGGIHLVYGEKDRYISQKLRERFLEVVKKKGESYIVLKGQDHSPWEYNLVQKVYKEELAKLKEYC